MIFLELSIGGQVAVVVEDTVPMEVTVVLAVEVAEVQRT
jgi:hypothetical protein